MNVMSRAGGKFELTGCGYCPIEVKISCLSRPYNVMSYELTQGK